MATGKTFKNQRNTIPKRRDAFFAKMEEYGKLTLDELKVLYNHPDKKQRPGGIYREALIEVVRKKQLEAVNTNIKDGIEELKDSESNIESNIESNLEDNIKKD